MHKEKTTLQKILYGFYVAIYVTIIAVTFSSDTTLPKMSSMLIIPIAFFTVLVRADFDSLKKTYTFPMYLVFAMLFIYLHSIIIWIVHLEKTQFIMDGSLRLLFQIINILVAYCAVYMFGSKSIDYTMYGSIIVNTVFFVMALAKHGISNSVNDFINTVQTGDQAGFMGDMEIHQLTYVYGFFIVYYLFISDYSKKKKALYIGLCVFYMLLGWKRIIFASVAITLALAGLFYILPKKWKSGYAWIISIVTAVVAFIYIPLISSGLFEKLMNSANVDTMSRIDAYNYVRPTYEFSPLFFGKGSEFVVRYVANKREAKEASNGITMDIRLIHNDILVRYIEMGFFGFIGWLYFMCISVFKWLKKHYGLVAAVVYAVINNNNFINFSVGNTNRSYCVRLVIEMFIFVIIYKSEVEDAGKNTDMPSVRLGFDD